MGGRQLIWPNRQEDLAWGQYFRSVPGFNERDIAKDACSGPEDNYIIDDDEAGGSTTCYQPGITTSCDAQECVTIIDDPRLSHRTNGSGAHSAAVQR